MPRKFFVLLPIILPLIIFGFVLQAAPPRALGLIRGQGDARVNGVSLQRSSSLFAGDVISTADDSLAWIYLTPEVQVILAEQSQLECNGSRSRLQLSLAQGKVQVRDSGNDPLTLKLFNSSVDIQAVGAFPASYVIVSNGSETSLSVLGGQVGIQNGRNRLELSTGQQVKFSAQPQAAATEERAGEVTALIPRDLLERSGQEVEIKLKDEVQWNDIIRTLERGRVRVALLDGSTINIGARSTFRVLRHDTESQQTEVELTFGRARARIRQLTRPDASFELRTQTAVIGVVGTLFAVEAEADVTRVYCLEGRIRVRNIDLTVPGEVTLDPGQMTEVVRGLPPTGAVQAPASQVQSQMSQTQIEGLPGAQVAPTSAPGGAPGGAVTTTSTVSTAPTAPSGVLSSAMVTNVAAGASAGSVITSGIAASKAGGAADQTEAAASATQTTLTSASTLNSSSASLEDSVESLDLSLDGLITDICEAEAISPGASPSCTDRVPTGELCSLC